MIQVVPSEYTTPVQDLDRVGLQSGYADEHTIQNSVMDPADTGSVQNNHDAIVVYTADSAKPASSITSLFEGHELQGNNLENIRRETKHTDLVFLALMLALLLFTVVRSYYGKRLKLITSAVFSKANANNLLREGNIFRNQSFLPMLFIFLVSSGMYIYLLLEYFGFLERSQHIPVITFLEIYGVFAGFILLKLFLLFLSGQIFRNSDTTFEYIHNIFLFAFFNGILLIPFIILILYANATIFIYTSLTALLILFLYRFLRGFAIGSGSVKFSYFHLFLYLCTLEILPLVVLAKVVLIYTSNIH